MEPDGVETQQYVLKEKSELRVECGDEEDVFVQLLEGSAEVFGAEVQLGSKINLRGHKLAIYTWKGCKLKVQGEPTLVYVADQTPMPTYLALHSRLTQRREAAASAQSSPLPLPPPSAGAPAASPPLLQGPRVVLVGPADSGKSSVTRMLLNWGVRAGWEPTYVDLDVGQGSITAPGCVAAVPVEAPLQPWDGGGGVQDIPLVYFYGHASAGDNPELYKFLVDRLAAVLDRRATASPTAAAAGLVINTLGWTEGLGYELQVHAILALKADVVVVLEQDRLFSQLTAEFKGRAVEVVKLAKSGGVVERSREERKGAREARLRHYFYGPQHTLMPAVSTVKANQLKVFRVGGGPKAPTSALPIGSLGAGVDPLRVTLVPVTSELVQSVLAVSHAMEPDQLLTANVAGFILVKEVDMARGTISFLSPCPGPLPGKYLIGGSLRSAMD